MTICHNQCPLFTPFKLYVIIIRKIYNKRFSYHKIWTGGGLKGGTKYCNKEWLFFKTECANSH